jgi:hypothetical protein
MEGGGYEAVPTLNEAPYQKYSLHKLGTIQDAVTARKIHASAKN